MSDADHQFNFGFSICNQAVQNDNNAFESFLDSIATQGGDSIYQFFASDMSALQNLYQACLDPNAWLSGTDPNNLPVQYVQVGSNYLMAGSYFTDDGVAQLQNGTADSNTFAEVGAGYLALTVGSGTDQERTSQIMACTINYAGNGIAETVQEQARATLIAFLVDRVTDFVKTFVKAVLDQLGLSATEADAAVTAGAQKAQTQAGTDSEVIAISSTDSITVALNFVFEAADVAISLGTFVYGLVMCILAKQMTAYVRFYNATSQEVDFSLCFLEPNCTSVLAPLIPNDVKTIPGISPGWAPEWCIGSNPIHYIDLAYTNTSATADLGFVLKASPNGAFPGFNVLASIPNHSENTLYASFSAQDDCLSYWGAYKNSSATTTVSTTSSNYTLRVATNQLQGESPSPTNGALGYNYEYLIVLEES